jgi:hypothetical protein
MVSHMNGDEQTGSRVRLPEVVARLYDVLEPLDPSVRAKAIRAVLTMFDDEQPNSERRELPSSVPHGPVSSRDGHGSGSTFAVGKRAQLWLSKHGLGDDLLDRVFHMENGQPTLYAPVPGTKKREQTINAYLLTGAQGFLATDEPRFSDASAVALCKRTGCYDQANHAQTRGAFGNRITGNKEAGFTLTTPGLEQAAALIKDMANE